MSTAATPVMTSNLSPGSTWRKWDLQACTKHYSNYCGPTLTPEQLELLSSQTCLPKEKINSAHREVSDEEYAKIYVEYLAHFTDLSVVAITNHNTGHGLEAILNYLAAKAACTEERYKNLHIFPGVEIGASDKCHILAIFNPASQNKHKYEYDQRGTRVRELSWDEYIERFLDAIGVPAQRFESGKPASSASRSTCGILDLCEDWDFLPVFPHVNDGAGWYRELPENLRKESFRHAMFGIVDTKSVGANSDLRRILSGQKAEYGPKVTAQIETSDAQSISQIGSRFVWVKADPTFEGLRQILFEPSERVYVGDEAPSLKNPHEVIKSVRVVNAPDWFWQTDIPLNSDLVAIIGGRGSGKSALVELMALAGGSERFNQNEYTKESFLAKASKKTLGNPHPLIGAKIELMWQSGEVDEVQVPYPLRQPRAPEKVKFLPQKFVERLCDPENPAEIQEEIERVVFQRLDEKNRQGASNFTELRNIITQKSVLKAKKLRQSIQELNQRIAEARSRIDAFPQKEAELVRKENELKKLDEAKPELAEENRRDIEELEELAKARQQVQRQISSRNEQLSELDALNTRIDLFAEDVAAYNEDIRTRLQRIGLDTQADAFLMRVPDVKSILAIRKETLLSEIRILEIGGDGATTPSLSELDKKIADIRGRLQLSETKRKGFEKYQAERQTLVGAIHALREEIQEIQGSAKESLALNLKDRFERYLDIFDVLQEERRTLEDLYGPLREVLQSGGDVGRKLTFWSRINADLNAHTQRCLDELLDRTRRGRYREENALGIKIGEFLRRIEESEFQRETIRTAVAELYDSFFSDTDGNQIRIADQLRVRKAERDFDDWFFNTDLFSVSYSIKFDNKDLQLLSPGQKGIVLLLLYLEIEQEDRRPLIIDQPEENLDNISIYDNLVEYFRKCKKNRQIIMITHNPNLVVNADAEQVIVADFDGARTPKISYQSGALENTVMRDGSPGIREHVCKILEGGAEAFRRREKKYSLPPA